MRLHTKQKSERPIAFASKTLNKAEIFYSQEDKETLNTVIAIKNSIKTYSIESLF